MVVQQLGSPETFKKASFWQRLLALLIDGFLMGFFFGIPLSFFDFFRTHEWIEFWLFYTYCIVSERYFQATLGKMIVGIQVIGVDGQPPGWIDSMTRNFAKQISALPLGYGFIRLLAPHRRQTIHDGWGKCLVIDIRHERKTSK
jgi:uncharacterized RDD family membrane protein YckC